MCQGGVQVQFTRPFLEECRVGTYGFSSPANDRCHLLRRRARIYMTLIRSCAVMEDLLCVNILNFHPSETLRSQ